MERLEVHGSLCLVLYIIPISEIFNPFCRCAVQNLRVLKHVIKNRTGESTRTLSIGR
jgi:hypothetical protein